MLNRLRELLRSETVADIQTSIAAINLGQLQTDLTAATTRRAELLLTGTDAQVLAAEREIDTARLALERSEAARISLEDKLADATAKEAEAAFRARYNAAVTLRDEVVAKIEKDYAAAAGKIIAVLAADVEAVAVLAQVNRPLLYSEGETYGLPPIKTPSQYLWGDTITTVGLGISGLQDRTSLLPTATTPAVDPWGTMNS